ncbi:hypothetical protein GCK72_015220 [Caenorhabditis remanei]|uniref:Uncharacterized protein n=1 Tax=Caenorhabditis remanei TaxID=31234 RepID=A0A6A5GTH9_CAERE|nr:hypothetical protein GCK72_015220 [Caenorhabditis remanei]KAF1758760.1 hypothetical protein GCK72_015220 [Caenorhabditis remanei]
MVLFQHPQKSSTDIHPYVYKSFLCMQVSKLISSILELMIIRLPQTTILTSYYSTLERDSPLRIFASACFSLNNLSQLFTVLFCLMRLLVFLNRQARFERLYIAIEAIFDALTATCVVVFTLLKLVKLKNMKQLKMNLMRYTFVLPYKLVYFFVYLIIFNTSTYVFFFSTSLSSCGNSSGQKKKRLLDIFRKGSHQFNMNLSNEQVEKFYVSIYLNPEYENISYHFDYVTVIVIACFICFIPTIYATVRMVLYRQPQKTSTDIHPYVYKSFLCMQVSKVISSILYLIVIRIPQTTILTSYYSTLKRDSPLRIFVAAYFSLDNLSQLFTVLFCSIRLLVFINKEERLERLYSVVEVIVNAVISICVVVLTLLMLIKLKNMKQLSSISSKNTKAERTLTITMLIILLPIVFDQFFTRLSAVVEVVFNAVISICVVVSTLLMLVKLKNMKQLSSISSKNTKAEKTLTITMFIIVYPTVLDEFIARLYTAVEVISYALTTICVVVLTLLMLVKLKNMKQLSSISSKNTKAEKTLTITMLIILFPIVFDEIFTSVSYNIDFVTVIVVATFICFIPTIYSTVRMVLYRHPQKSSTDIHPYVFKSFICMQVSEVLFTVTDFGVVRIAWTTVMTSYYSTSAPDSPLRIFVAAFYSFAYLSQLFIVLFCLVRLLVFMNNQDRSELASFFATSYASYIILIRLISMDCRVNIVSWYFYWTYPYFKKSIVPKTVNAWSVTNC